ncbi:helix-turn-helix domain-containing protein, partial [Acinetobacter baumannii]|nr:XRE family transcriptional regulator [Acinetobacter baumannii]
MSVWNDIADTPPEAENLRVRSELMMAIEKQITERGWTQVQAADALGLTQPRASDLLRGKVSKFSLDSLVGMAFGLGIQLRADVGESAGSFITTYSLTEVAAMVLPKNW